MNEANIREVLDRIVSGSIAEYKLDQLVSWAEHAIMREVDGWNADMNEGKLPREYNNPFRPSYDNLSITTLLAIIDKKISPDVLKAVEEAQERYREMKSSAETE